MSDLCVSRSGVSWWTPTRSFGSSGSLAILPAAITQAQSPAMELPGQLAVISFHSVPILFSHSLNDGRSTSSNSGQAEIDCGDSHG